MSHGPVGGKICATWSGPDQIGEWCYVPGSDQLREAIVSRHWIAEPSATAREVKGPFIMGSRTSGTSAVRHDWKREREREFKETQRGEVID